MSDAGWTDKVTAIGTLISAVGTIGLVGLAYWALTGWKDALTSQRADECVCAARDLASAVGRFISVAARAEAQRATTAIAYDQIWHSWRRFDQAFSAARRYHRNFDSGIPRKIAEKIYSFENWLDPQLSADAKAQAKKAEADINALLTPACEI